MKIKLAAFPFQKYGMLEGTVAQVSADATESPNPNTRSGGLAGRDRAAGPLAFRTLIDLKHQQLESDGHRYALAPGMQVMAEIHLGDAHGARVSAVARAEGVSRSGTGALS